MYIKRMVMHGFKSFPRKTDVPFTPGINVILGPNGSGKSNVSDALCFVLGRLSVKSMRAAKAENLIFLGTKEASPAKEASVEVVLDNSQKVFSLPQNEISIKRIVRKNGQSVYRINDETKTRQEILTLLSQAGIDPQGFNIVLQGEIQNFARMNSEERRGIIEEVSGISVYESRKEKSIHELEKTEERLEEIASILRERTLYLNNLEKERQQALKYKKLESDIKRLKASIISSDLHRKKKDVERVVSEIATESKEAEKTKKAISEIESEISGFKGKIEEINSNIQKSTGLEQEKINQEIANLRAEIAGMTVRLENHETRFDSLSAQKNELQKTIEDEINSLKELKNEPVTEAKKTKEIDEKKKIFEKIEEQRKKFYAAKSEVNSLKDRINDKESLLKSYEIESSFLVKQIDAVSLEISDHKSNKSKLEKLNENLSQVKSTLNKQSKRRVELEKKILLNKVEIENQQKTVEKISKLDICPVCKSKVTREHLEEIRMEFSPKAASLKSEIDAFSSELNVLLKSYEENIKEVQEINEKVSKTQSDITKLNSIEEKKSQIKNIHEKAEASKAEISQLNKKRDSVEDYLLSVSGIDQKYENLKIEIQEISLRTKQNVGSEVSFKERELERLKISLKQTISEESEASETLSEMTSELIAKEKILSQKRHQEEELSRKFQKLISERDEIQRKIRENESETLKKQHLLHITEQKINEFKIEKARVDAEAENLETEMLAFPGVELIQGNRESLVQRLARAQEEISMAGTVNLKSLEVYDSIKKEYDSVKEKAEIIAKEKESIMKVIEEIDIKKRRVFVQTLKQLNELFSRNFSELSLKGQVFLELENPKDPFEQGSGVQIIMKTGHGKYFDIRSLSGGEQTLVVLSLIFAIQEYRPYSFYLFDEIDAALDKRNSERLAELLNKYMQKGQYIVITHNEEIISNATNLYGVSMHEGISKIISLKV